MLKVDLSRQAAKLVKKLSTKPARQVFTKIIELRSDPYPPDSLKLKGYSYHRKDSGEYRIVYQVEDGILKIFLIGKRNNDEVYKKLKRKF